MTGFVAGLELARAYYDEVVADLVGTKHSAALLGWGSEILGFDTERSTDHGWGPRLQIFVEEPETVRDAIEAGLPEGFRGWRTRFGWDEVPVTHHVQVARLEDWLREQLGFDPRPGMSTRDWLTTPQQLLLGIIGGAVFHDGLGELEPLRERLEWYPREVWLWLLACQWRRIDQEEPFVGRTAEVGDELGSRVLASRLARDLIRLCFLLERRYAPYSMWLGSGFARLDAAAELGPKLESTVAATDFRGREEALIEAVELVAGRHNALGVTAPVEPTVRLFHERPFRVLGSGRFVDACLAEVSDPWLRALPLVGAIDQFVDSVDVLTAPDVSRRLGSAYEE